MKLALQKEQHQTIETTFTNNPKTILIKPFRSNIIGLRINLYGADGKNVSIPFIKTNKGIRIRNIARYIGFDFSFRSANKDYELDITLKR